MIEIREVLEKNNTTAGRLAAILALAEKYWRQREELRKKLEELQQPQNPPPLGVQVADTASTSEKIGG